MQFAARCAKSYKTRSVEDEEETLPTSRQRNLAEEERHSTCFASCVVGMCKDWPPAPSAPAPDDTLTQATSSRIKESKPPAPSWVQHASDICKRLPWVRLFHVNSSICSCDRRHVYSNYQRGRDMVRMLGILERIEHWIYSVLVTAKECATETDVSKLSSRTIARTQKRKKRSFAAMYCAKFCYFEIAA